MEQRKILNPLLQLNHGENLFQKLAEKEVPTEDDKNSQLLYTEPNGFKYSDRSS